MKSRSRPKLRALSVALTVFLLSAVLTSAVYAATVTTTVDSTDSVGKYTSLKLTSDSTPPSMPAWMARSSAFYRRLMSGWPSRWMLDYLCQFCSIRTHSHWVKLRVNASGWLTKLALGNYSPPNIRAELSRSQTWELMTLMALPRF